MKIVKLQKKTRIAGLLDGVEKEEMYQLVSNYNGFYFLINEYGIEIRIHERDFKVNEERDYNRIKSYRITRLNNSRLADLLRVRVSSKYS